MFFLANKIRAFFTGDAPLACDLYSNTFWHQGYQNAFATLFLFFQTAHLFRIGEHLEAYIIDEILDFLVSLFKFSRLTSLVSRIQIFRWKENPRDILGDRPLPSKLSNRFDFLSGRRLREQIILGVDHSRREAAMFPLAYQIYYENLRLLLARTFWSFK